MESISTMKQYQEQIAKEKLTVIKFYTTWCPDCKNLDRFIGEVLPEHTDKEWLEMDADNFLILLTLTILDKLVPSYKTAEVFILVRKDFKIMYTIKSNRDRVLVKIPYQTELIPERLTSDMWNDSLKQVANQFRKSKWKTLESTFCTTLKEGNLDAILTN